MFQGLSKFLSESAERLRNYTPTNPEGALRIINVNKGSAAEACGLEPFYDFILTIDGQTFTDPAHFKDYVRNNPLDMELKIWSIKGQMERKAYLRALPSNDSSAGFSVDFSSVSEASNSVWHVLQIEPNSPSALAGLREFDDYIVASSERALKEESALALLIEDFMDQPLHLFIYNCNDDSTRQVTIVPNKIWGGQGSLGCGVGFGALHRLPAPITKRSADNVQEDIQSSNLLVPADTQYDLHVQEKAIPGEGDESRRLSRSHRKQSIAGKRPEDALALKQLMDEEERINREQFPDLERRRDLNEVLPPPPSRMVPPEESQKSPDNQ